MTAPTVLSFNVAGNPVGQNAAYRIVQLRGKRGRPGHATLMLSTKGRVWKHEVSRIAVASRPPDWDLDNEYLVECVWYFDSRRPDCDGPAKLTLDALAKWDDGPVLMRNDRQVWTFTQRRELDKERPRAEITIRLRRAPEPNPVPLLLGEKA